MTSAQKYRLGSFTLDFLLITTLVSLADDSARDLLAVAFVLILLCVSHILYAEYFLQKYGPKKYGVKS